MENKEMNNSLKWSFDQIFHTHKGFINHLCKKWKKKNNLQFDDLKTVCMDEILNLVGKIDLNRTEKEIHKFINIKLENRVKREVFKEGNLIHIPEKALEELYRVKRGMEEWTKKLKSIDKLEEVVVIDESLTSEIPTPEEVYQMEEFKALIRTFKDKFMTEEEKENFNKFYGMDNYPLEESDSLNRFIRSNFKKKFKRSKEMKAFIGKYKELINKIYRKG